jgi:hypothetical protein
MTALQNGLVVIPVALSQFALARDIHVLLHRLEGATMRTRAVPDHRVGHS